MARRPIDEFLILDLETVPDSVRWPRPEPPAPSPPAPPVAPASVTPAPPADGFLTVSPTPPAPPRAERQQRREDTFPPTWAHRIVAIGCLWLDRSYAVRRFDVLGTSVTAIPGDSASEDARERTLLEQFSALVGSARPVIVTYNGRSFDLPVIALRALCHAVPLPWYYRDRNVRSRYSEDGHLDLCDWLADHGATRAGKLDAVARLIGLPGKVGVDGSQVEGLYSEGKLAEIESYCLADVAQTALLFLRFRLLQGRMTIEQYRDRAAALVDTLTRDGRVASIVDNLDRPHLLAEPARA